MYHCPDAKRNLMSISQLDTEGYSSIFSHGKYYLLPSNQLNQYLPKLQENFTASGYLKDGLYQMNINIPTVNFARKSSRTTEQWHRTLNHTTVNRLQHSAKSLDGLQLLDSELCKYTACSVGKSVQRPYTSTSPESATRSGHTICADTWYATVPDSASNLYYLVFIDHYSLKS